MIEVALPFDAPPVLAVGAYLKNSVAAAKGRRAVISQSGNNLDSPEDIRRFKDELARMMDWLGEPPRRIAHDLHPDFPNTRHAQSLGLPCLAVQHHHAHVAAVAAEHGVLGPVIGLALDGFGLGPGNQAWGGEFLLADGAKFERLGHLALLAQPGGDVAARQPWRMAAAALHALGRTGRIAARFADQPGAKTVSQMLEKGLNCPPTSSCGRLFDAACGLLGVLPVAEFEGQAPMALESLVTGPEVMADGWRIEDGTLSFLPLLERLDGMDARLGANLFHGTLAAGLSAFAAQAAQAHDVDCVALSGGCFLNKVLTAGIEKRLSDRGFKVLKADRLSPGDSGLALGQAWVAALKEE
ncbi:MAG: hydrogenase maturation protein HypF [Rhodospirillales bacterium]|nr:MAG: hydrogenase maturation protein HypF [Rhodospirillales bacterium]